MKTVILIPTYNERENIVRLIPQIASLLPTAFITVIDDRSPDGTGDAVRQLMTTHPHLTLLAREKKEGLGRAYADALQKTLADPTVTVVCMIDADFSHDPNDLLPLIASLAEAEVAIGSRYVPGGNIEGWEWIRRTLSALGNSYCRLVTRMPIKDSTSGFYAIRASTLRQLSFSAADPSGYAFQVHLKYHLWKLGAHIKEHPITFRNRVTGESKISLRIVEEGLLLPWRLLRQEKKESTASR